MVQTEDKTDSRGGHHLGPRVSGDSPLWRLFLDSSCTSATAFFKLHLSAQTYFHSPTPWSPPRNPSLVSRKVAKLLDSFRPGSSSYCPFQTKPLTDTNNNRLLETEHILVRPSQLGSDRTELRVEEYEENSIGIQSVSVSIPSTSSSPSNSTSTSSSTTSFSTSSNSSEPVTPEEEIRRRLYLPLGRPRPFYRQTQTQEEVVTTQGTDSDARKEAKHSVRSLQEEVRAQLVQRYGLVRLSKIIRTGEDGVSLPTVVRNFLFTFPCQDFQEEGCQSLRSSASYNIRCCLDDRRYLAIFATNEIDKTASNLWEEQRGWLTGLDTERVRQVLALAVDPLTENIFYIMDIDRGETLSSLVSRVSSYDSLISLDDELALTRDEAITLITEGTQAALDDCNKAGLTFPGLRPDRVWLVKGKVVLENGLMVKGGVQGSASGEEDISTITKVLRGEEKKRIL